jgi:hypothetical protein
MKERLFVPVNCPCCHKRIVLALASAQVETALEENLPIMLQCAFDETRWPASPAERHRIARLHAEENVDNSWLRLSPGNALSHHRSW